MSSFADWRDNISEFGLINPSGDRDIDHCLPINLSNFGVAVIEDGALRIQLCQEMLEAGVPMFNNYQLSLMRSGVERANLDQKWIRRVDHHKFIKQYFLHSQPKNWRQRIWHKLIHNSNHGVCAFLCEVHYPDPYHYEEAHLTKVDASADLRNHLETILKSPTSRPPIRYLVHSNRNSLSLGVAPDCCFVTYVDMDAKAPIYCTSLSDLTEDDDLPVYQFEAEYRPTYVRQKYWISFEQLLKVATKFLETGSRPDGIVQWETHF